MTIEESIYARLIADAVLSTHVGDRIFPSVVPDYTTPQPYIVYHVSDREPVDAISAGVSKATMQFEVIGPTYLQVRTIGDIIITLLDGWRGGAVRRCWWSGDSTDLIDEDSGYLYSASYTVIGQGGTVVSTASAQARVVTGVSSVAVQPNGIDTVMTAHPDRVEVGVLAQLSDTTVDGILTMLDSIRTNGIQVLSPTTATLQLTDMNTGLQWSLALTR